MSDPSLRTNGSDLSSQSTNQPLGDPGSFRDPLSRVIIDDQRVLRVARGRGVADLREVLESGFLTDQIAAGRVIGTEVVTADKVDGSTTSDEQLKELLGWSEDDSDVLVLAHERLPVISYPYEWTFSMLQDAALLQLDLALAAFDAGMAVKDATPYNVQFRGPQPVFIDVGSFEKLQPSTPWYGYRQFCEMFLNPLMLQSLRDVGFQPWMRGSINGIGPVELAALLRWRDRFRKGVMVHVVMHARSERRHADSQRDMGAELRQAGFSSAMVRAQLQGLRKTVHAMSWGRSESTWSNYSERAHYGDTDLQIKEDFVDSVVGAKQRDLVWDLGANDGRFSRIAAKNSAMVVAADMDPLVIDHLYKTLRNEVASNGADADIAQRILPLTMDLIDSSPSQGWRGQERGSFWTRSSPDVVLALALVHHLVIPGNVPPVEVVRWLADMNSEVVLEVPHDNDPMVQRLLKAKREDLRALYSLSQFDDHVPDHFDVRRREVLPGGTRTLLHLTPKA